MSKEEKDYIISELPKILLLTFLYWLLWSGKGGELVKLAILAFKGGL